MVWEKGMLGLMEKVLEDIGQAILLLKMAVLQVVTSVGLIMIANVLLIVESLVNDGTLFVYNCSSLVKSLINSKADDLIIHRYHIPRLYMNKGKENTLILFEEFGGMPLDIDIQTTRVKKVCAKPYLGSTLELSCHDRIIKEINFVGFGNPRGNCGNFQKGACDSSSAFSVIEKVNYNTFFFFFF